jgi:uncharacterized membrane protein YcaP (DUF421 family)
MPSFVLTLIALPFHLGPVNWENIFWKFPSMGEKMLRPMIVYLFLVIVLRIFGKRELAQLNPFDLVVLLTLSNTVQNAIIGDDSSITGGLIGAFTLLMLNYLVVRFLFRHRRLDQMVEGKPTILIKQGRLKRRAMGQELMNESELLTVAHRQGFGSLDEIEECVLESGGTFYLKGKTPPKDEARHEEVLAKLEELSRQLAALQARA